MESTAICEVDAILQYYETFTVSEETQVPQIMGKITTTQNQYPKMYVPQNAMLDMKTCIFFVN